MKISIGEHHISFLDGYVRKTKKKRFVEEQSALLSWTGIDRETLEGKLGEVHDLIVPKEN